MRVLEKEPNDQQSDEEHETVMSFFRLPWVHWFQARWKGNLHLRLTIGMAIVIVFIMSLASAFMMYSQEKAFRHAAEAKGRAFSQAFALMGSAAVLKNLFIIQEAMTQYLDDPDVLEVDIIDQDNMIMAAKNTSRIGKTVTDSHWLNVRVRKQESVIHEKTPDGIPILVVVEPLVDEGFVNAWIRIVFSLKKFEEEAATAMVRLGILTTLLISASIFAVRVSQRKVSGAMHNLSKQLKGALLELETSNTDPHALSGNERKHSGRGDPSHQGEFEKATSLATEATHLLQHHTEVLEEKVQERTEELQIARDQAMKATQAKSAFLAEMSHEIRTPMNGVLGLSELLLNTSLTADQRKYSELIRQSAESLLRVINEILDLSKIEAGKGRLDLSNMDINEVVENAAELLRPQANQKGIGLSSHIAKEIPHRVRGDSLRVWQILINLLGNAIKFTENGTVSIVVTLVQQTTDSTSIRFAVTDTGIGISPDVQERMFQPFTHGGGDTFQQSQSTGLGLTISKQLVDMMGGMLVLKSAVGAGSTFECTLTFENISDGKCSSHLPQAIPQESMCLPPLGLNTLVIEDDVVSQEVTTGMLNLLGCATFIVGRGHAAIEAIRHHSFDLILMDWQLPDMDGFQLTQIIRQFEMEQSADQPRRMQPTPIIAVTAHVVYDLLEHDQPSGIHGFLPKPFSIRQLRRTIEDTLSSLGAENPLLHESFSSSEQSEPMGLPEIDLRGLSAHALDPQVVATLRRIQTTSDQDFFHRVVDQFLVAAPARLAELEQACHPLNVPTFTKAAHSLKSCCGSIGAMGMRNLCQKLEQEGHIIKGWEREAALRKLKQEFQSAKKALLTLKHVR